MKRTLLSLAVLAAFAFVMVSCKKENPSTEIPAAIQKLIDSAPANCICDPYIQQYTWRGEAIYMSGARGPACSWYPIYYHADGTRLIMPATYSLFDFQAEARLVREVWTCKQIN